jgi:hypothetical protein
MTRPQYQLKTPAEKKEEVIRVIRKLADLGLGLDIPEIKEFYGRLQEYLKGDYPISGKLRIRDHQRTLIFNLSQRVENEIKVELRHDGPKPQ